jgi:hypothetical protein
LYDGIFIHLNEEIVNVFNSLIYNLKGTWVCARLCTRLAAASDKVYQLLAHGRWFFPGTPASSATKTGRHDITEILLKVALSTTNQSINQRDGHSIFGEEGYFWIKLNLFVFFTVNLFFSTKLT